MKNQFLKILANRENKKAQKVYNELLKLYSQIAEFRQVYHYQLGYTPSKLENLKYEIKKKTGITDKEIALYNPEMETEEDNLGSPADPNMDGSDANLNSSKPAAEANPIIAEMDEPVYQGLKLRDEYPFLNDENCPDELKVLVSDKITAYKNYAAKHAEALEAADQSEAEDKLYELAKEAVSQFQNNIDIKDELDHYRDTNGKILGKHPKLKDLKILQEIGEMSEAELVKHRNNALKSVSKYAKAGNTEKEAEWSFRLEKTEKNLTDKYNHKFEK